MRPDVARLGGLYLRETRIFDEMAQHIKIEKIIRHPQHRFASKYFDIALMQLEKNADINSYVGPACLFTEDDAPYDRFVAAGWGDTGFAEKMSDKLLKVEISPISNQNCSEYYPSSRSLAQGLVHHQLCAVDDIMDTCKVKNLIKYLFYISPGLNIF